MQTCALGSLLPFADRVQHVLKTNCHPGGRFWEATDERFEAHGPGLAGRNGGWGVPTSRQSRARPDDSIGQPDVLCDLPGGCIDRAAAATYPGVAAGAAVAGAVYLRLGAAERCQPDGGADEDH